MLIVAGHLVARPRGPGRARRGQRRSSAPGAQAHGCLDFAVSADPVDPARVNVFERWMREEDLRAFREVGSDDDAQVDFDRIVAVEVEKYVVGGAA